MRRNIIFLISLVFTINSIAGDAPKVKPEEDVPWCLETFLKRVPPLKHDFSGRLPFITWEPFRATKDDKSFDEGKALPEELYREIAKRGFTQRIPLNEKYIEMALAIQKAGLPVVFMEGSGGPGPLPAGEKPENYQHKLTAGYKLGKDEKINHCPLLTAGWHERAEKLRATLGKYKDAGVKVTAAWLDWEDEPWGSEDRWAQSAACTRCRAMFPAAALADAKAYQEFIGQFRRNLFSAYLAAPVREFYPECSVTNWAMVFSAADHPVRSGWGDRYCSVGDIGLMNATNPVVYGNTVYLSMHWKKDWNWPVDVPHMDRLYTEIMLGNVSGNAFNQQRAAPWTLCVPWVDRYCPDVEDESIPILSRERYREILRHVWFRGADSMQVFNAFRTNHPVIATEECEDVVSICDEVLEYREFLDKGLVINTEEPTAKFDGAIWSGMRLGDKAVVRAFTQAAQPVKFTIKAWDNGPGVELEAPPAGKTWLLYLENEKVRAESR